MAPIQPWLLYHRLIIVFFSQLWLCFPILPPLLSILHIYLYNPYLLLFLVISPWKPRQLIITPRKPKGACSSILRIIISLATIFCTYRRLFHWFFLNGIICNPYPNTMVPTFSATNQQELPLLNNQPQTILQVDLHGPIRVLPSHYCVLTSWN